MVNKQTGASGPPSTHDPPERRTVPPTSHVGLNEAGRKKAWIDLLKKIEPPMASAGGELSTICQEARKLAEHVGQLALQSFSLLSAGDREEIIAAATERFFRSCATFRPNTDNPERLFLHAIRCEVVALTKRRFEEAERGSPPRQNDKLDVRFLYWLDQARQRMMKLRRLQQRVLRLTLALDSISPVVGDDRSHHRTLPFLIGLSLGLRVNSVHQHQARLRRKLFSADPGRRDISPTDALRYLWAPPFALAYQALTFLTMHQTHGGEASRRLHSAKEAYAECLKESKERSEQARCAFHELVAALDASGITPHDVQAPLLSRCKELRIDDRVSAPKKNDRTGQAKSQGRSWAAILLEDEGRRPIGAGRDAWKSFLVEHMWVGEVPSRWSEFEKCSVDADAARAAVAVSYQALLTEANQLEDIVNTIENLVHLVGA